MQFLLTALGSAGDVHPVIGIGAALASRGHDVVIVSNPYFEASVRDAALDFIPIGTLDDYVRAVENPDLWHPRKGTLVTIEYGIVPSLQPLFEVVARFDPAKTLVTGTLLCFGARIASEARGFRYVSTHIQPAAIASAYEAPIPLPKWMPVRFRRALLRTIYTKMIDPHLGEVSRFRAQLGLEPASNYFGQWLHSPDASLALWPDWFAAPQPDWPPHTEPVGFIGWDPGADDPLPHDVAEFIDGGDAPILFTAGSAAMHSHEFFETAVNASKIIGRRAILVSRSRKQVPRELPPSILHVEFVPFGTLLPRVAALVHHGGIGTLAQAFRAGIPQLVMPMAHDQPDNASRLERLGTGMKIPPRRFKAKRVAAVLTNLLASDSVRSRCSEIAKRVAFEESRLRAATALERLHPESVGLRPASVRHAG